MSSKWTAASPCKPMEKATVILYAMSEEAALIHRRLGSLRQTLSDGETKAWSAEVGGRTLVLAQTGIGRKRAIEAVEKLAKKFEAQRLFSIGYAGAVDPQLKAGDLLVADQVVRLDGLEEREAYDADASLSRVAMAAASHDGRPAWRGKIVTFDQFVAETSRKRQIFMRTGAQVVEMESIGIGEAAARLGIPAAFVRAVSDEADFELSTWYEHMAAAGGAGSEPPGVNSELRIVTDAFRKKSLLANQSLARFVARLCDPGGAFTEVEDS